MKRTLHNAAKKFTTEVYAKSERYITDIGEQSTDGSGHILVNPCSVEGLVCSCFLLYSFIFTHVNEKKKHDALT
jgi:hypothetical protein